MAIDLERMQLERVESSQSENFTFTLTDNDGSHVYGICLRGLFKGEGERHDVSRRSRQCLCIISKYPYFSFFRTILSQVHALALLHDQPGWARYYLDRIYTRPGTDLSWNGNLSLSIQIADSELPDLFYGLTYSTPKYTGLRISKREVSALQILETLGVESFLCLLSAVMCERRVLVIADSVDKLSSFILAIASMIHPFAWQHVFIPLLPSKLLDYVAAPMPYIIGVRRYLMPKLNNDILGEVLIIDADSGDLRRAGGINIVDFIGESGSAFKQATESFNMVKAKASGVANLFFGKASILDEENSSSSATNYSGPRDVVASVMSDLRSILNAKPGGGSLQSVASGILRTLPVGASKSQEELRVQWMIDSEKTLRDSVCLLFVYLFASLDEFAVTTHRSSSSSTTSQRNPAVPPDGRSSFDLNGFRFKRQQSGDSRELKSFLDEFMQSQMFERFCAERHRQLSREKASTSTFAADDEDLFSMVVTEVHAKLGSHAHAVAAIKQIIQSKSNDNSLGSDKTLGNDFHPATFRLTAEEVNLGVFDAFLDYFMPASASSSNATIRAIERVCMDAHQDLLCLKIMKTIHMRLLGAVASGCRGSSGASGMRALHLLRCLLAVGPVCVLSDSLNWVPIIRQLLRGSERHQTQQSTLNALEYMSQGTAVDARPAALSVLEVILDHRKFLLQRRVLWLQRHQRISFLQLTKTRLDALRASLLVPLSGTAAGQYRFPKFDKLHATLKPQTNDRRSLPSFDPSKLRLTQVSRALNIEEDGDDVVEEDSPVVDTRVAAAKPFSAHNSKNNLQDPVKLEPVKIAPKASAPPVIDLLNDDVPVSSSSQPILQPTSAKASISIDPWSSTATVFAPTPASASTSDKRIVNDPFAADPFATSTSNIVFQPSSHTHTAAHVPAASTSSRPVFPPPANGYAPSTNGITAAAPSYAFAPTAPAFAATIQSVPPSKPNPPPPAFLPTQPSQRSMPAKPQDPFADLDFLKK
jgi:hypothetical protein